MYRAGETQFRTASPSASSAQPAQASRKQMVLWQTLVVLDSKRRPGTDGLAQAGPALTAPPYELPDREWLSQFAQLTRQRFFQDPAKKSKLQVPACNLDVAERLIKVLVSCLADNLAKVDVRRADQGMGFWLQEANSAPETQPSFSGQLLGSRVPAKPDSAQYHLCILLPGCDSKMAEVIMRRLLSGGLSGADRATPSFFAKILAADSSSARLAAPAATKARAAAVADAAGPLDDAASTEVKAVDSYQTLPSAATVSVSLSGPSDGMESAVESFGYLETPSNAMATSSCSQDSLSDVTGPVKAGKRTSSSGVSRRSPGLRLDSAGSDVVHTRSPVVAALWGSAAPIKGLMQGLLKGLCLSNARSSAAGQAVAGSSSGAVAAAAEGRQECSQ